MEMNSKQIVENPSSLGESNQKVTKVAFSQSVNENFKLLFHRSDRVLFIRGTQQLAQQSKGPQFPVKLSTLILRTKNENVQHTSNKSKEINSNKTLVTCNSVNDGDHVKIKSFNRQTDENKPCSSLSVYGNDWSPATNKKQGDKSNSKSPGFVLKDSQKNNSPPDCTSSVILENKLAHEQFSSMGYSGHWSEIKDENREEIKDKFLPECGIDDAGENFTCSTEETYCKSPDLYKAWSHFVPAKKYENNNRKRYKDKLKKNCAQYSHSQSMLSCGEQVARKRSILPFSSSCREEASSSTQKNSVMGSLVSNIDCADNNNIDSGVSVGVDFVDSWLDIEDENKESVDRVVIPDDSNSVEDIHPGNAVTLVEGARTWSGTLVTSGVNKNHSATTSLQYTRKALSKTNKQNHQVLLERQKEMFEEHENINQAIPSQENTCTIPDNSNTNRTEQNPLSNFDFFSTYADVEIDVHKQNNVYFGDQFLENMASKEESPEFTVNPEVSKNTIQVFYIKEKSSLNLGKEKKQAPNYLVKTSSLSGQFECFTCHLFFDSSLALNNHKILHNHKDLYNCPCCKKVFKQAHNLNRHLQRYDCIHFKCSICNIKFSNRDAWQEHIPSHFVDCHVCGITCKSEKKLEQHMKTLHTVKTYLCPECNESFKSSGHKLKHLRSCHSDKYPRFTCSLCKHSFVLKDRLTQHLLRVHSEEKNFLCSDCGQGFVFNKNLQRHRIKHVTERLWECSVCSKSFKSKRYLKYHMTTHSGKKPHECGDCGRRFLRPSNLRCHMQLHAGEKKFHCEICKGSFFSRPSLTMHMARHLCGLPVIKHTIKCVICCLDMRHLKTSLKTHLRQHTLRPKAEHKGKFDCHICVKRFNSKHGLGCHINRHRNVNSFQCVKCKTVFRHFVSLLCHSYLHMRTKKFLCNICRREFSFMKGLRGHLKVHPGKYFYKCSVCKLKFPKHSILVKHLKQHVEERRLNHTVGGPSFYLKTQAGSHQS